MSGGLNPDITGTYDRFGNFAGAPLYKKTDEEWYIWSLPDEADCYIVNEPGHVNKDPHWWKEYGINGDYAPFSGAVGVATVADK